jgi:hypothetical protein
MKVDGVRLNENPTGIIGNTMQLHGVTTVVTALVAIFVGRSAMAITGRERRTAEKRTDFRVMMTPSCMKPLSVISDIDSQRLIANAKSHDPPT